MKGSRIFKILASNLLTKTLQYIVYYIVCTVLYSIVLYCIALYFIVLRFIYSKTGIGRLVDWPMKYIDVIRREMSY